MQAIVANQFGGPDVLEIASIPTPQVSDGTVLVKMRAAGVNPVDTYILSGTYAFQPPLPYTPGMDGAGVVEAVGDGVALLQPGDYVYVAGSITGTYAEFCLCNAAQVHPLPGDLSFEEGAAIGIPYASAFSALFHQGCQVMPEGRVLIHGASGAVGLAAVQIAKNQRAFVVGTAGSEAGKTLVSKAGADHVLDHYDPQHFTTALELTGGKGYHKIVEMLANVNLGNDLPLLAHQGECVVVGSRGEVTINPRDLMGRNASVIGMSLMNVPPEPLAHIHQMLRDMFREKRLRPVVSRTLPLAEAGQAHRDVIKSHANGKIVLVP